MLSAILFKEISIKNMSSNTLQYTAHTSKKYIVQCTFTSVVKQCINYEII